MLFKFKPILKQTLWGGDKIIPFKRLSADVSNVGESWEISGVPGNETVVTGGEYAGMTLNRLTAELGAKLVGADNYRRFGSEFPLLVKFIDARQDLSIQVHPSDFTAKRQGYERGKTEMWYLMNPEPGAKLFCGLKKEITPEDYADMVDKGTICEALAQYEAKAGDVFFLPGGRIHSVGAGCFLAEIQQTSDITWRIYDYRRRDKDGNYRELHTRQAAEAINFKVESDYRTVYRRKKNEGVSLIACPYFTTAVYDLNEPMTLDYSELDSFVILIAVAGEGTLADTAGNVTSLRAGETVLASATEETLRVEGTVKFLETFV
ncbi:MAG: class I mannose-6-phosphate isomerase [Prevotella sp.]|nr:class I mannose-6-phosphate isomerase [Prevotella sp.]